MVRLTSRPAANRIFRWARSVVDSFFQLVIKLWRVQRRPSQSGVPDRVASAEFKNLVLLECRIVGSWRLPHAAASAAIVNES